MKTETVAIDTLTPDPANVREHGKRNIAAIVACLTKFGQQRPILVGPGGVVIAGNGTLEALRQIGRSTVDIVRTDLEGMDAVAYAIADNRTAELASWTSELAGALQRLRKDYGALVAGFTDVEINKLVRLSETGIVGVDDIPGVSEAETNRGDLWALGRHRLLCGDATDARDVGRVCPRRVQLCLTDPPYSVDYGTSHEKRGGKTRIYSAYREAAPDPSELLGFMALVPSNVMVWSYPIDRHFQALAAAYDRHGWELRKELVWRKSRFAFWPGAQYQQAHEPIMVAARRGKSVGGHVPSDAGTVLEYDVVYNPDAHPTTKPAELWGTLLANHTTPGSGVFDPFLGSGTTLAVAESLGRTCFALQISPPFCDVAVARWERLTGKKGKRI